MDLNYLRVLRSQKVIHYKNNNINALQGLIWWKVDPVVLKGLRFDSPNPYFKKKKKYF